MVGGFALLAIIGIIAQFIIIKKSKTPPRSYRYNAPVVVAPQVTTIA
jgi:hypothetical protein